MTDADRVSHFIRALFMRDVGVRTVIESIAGRGVRASRRRAPRRGREGGGR